MDISSIQPNSYHGFGSPQLSAQQTTQRRELIQAAKSVNSSGVLGEQNELVFVINPGDHRAIMRLVDRNTHEVVMQVPPEYVLRLAEDLAQNKSP